MRKSILVLICSQLLAFTATYAQTTEYRNAMTYKALANDYLSPINGEYFKTDQWTYGAEVGYFRSLNKSFNLGVPVRLSTFDYPLDDTAGVVRKDLFGASVDVVGQYKFNNGYILKENSWFAPYLFAGVGGKFINLDDQVWDLDIPVGLGFNFRLVNGVSLQLQTEYRISALEQRNNLVHSAGLMFAFGAGPVDTDGDGIPDKDDACPEKAGKAEFKGCPDTDSDGITDAEDKCPTEAGTKEMNGCPDKDGDGIVDKDDACPTEKGTAKMNGCPDADNDGIADKQDDCPTVAGIAKFKGCPDTDGDGIVDSKDKCPTEKGTEANQGCPVRDRDNDGIEDDKDQCPDEKGIAKFNGCPDTDGDGVADKDDACPKVAGPASNKGCPEIKKEDQQVLIDAMSVQFETGSAKIKSQSFAVLDKVVDVLKRYDYYDFSIEGHTDNQGADKDNLALSIDRAKACYDYIVSKGVSSSRMTFTGYGESQPVDVNTTSAGRAKNRRTEFKPILKKK